MNIRKTFLRLFGLLAVLSVVAFFLFHQGPQLQHLLPSTTSQQAASPEAGNDSLNRASNNIDGQQQPVDVWRVWLDK
ncbi:hypothetical protein C6501_07700 [Candidatus Poribacteria bacterium]|nr:MAG: hypothetical protein C6501_07700 [Candidatus Poribacteria bacterium]